MLLEIRPIGVVARRPRVEMDNRVAPRVRWHATVLDVVVLLDGAVQQTDGRRQHAGGETREIVAEKLDLWLNVGLDGRLAPRHGLRQDDCAEQEVLKAHAVVPCDFVRRVSAKGRMPRQGPTVVCMPTKPRRSSEGNGKQTSSRSPPSKPLIMQTLWQDVRYGLRGIVEPSRIRVSGNPDTGAGDGRDHDDLQRDSEHRARSVPVHGRPPRRRHPDPRPDLGSTGRPGRLSGSRVPRVSGAEPRLRGGHRRHRRGCAAVDRRGHRALRRRRRHRQHVHVPRRSAGPRSHIHAGRCQPRARLPSS